ncbi:hypothetical protein DVH24_036652 [Malus domestica]|uniref:Uncharacterized protein n=1 Tax=Malus domestica TaxID=3750 RepID=A0A498ILH4_MALDO|nr:hypothetical protein DVH24_036652 [Malus domestica]
MRELFPEAEVSASKYDYRTATRIYEHLPHSRRLQLLLMVVIIRSCNLRNRTWSTICITHNLRHRQMYDLIYFDGILLASFRSNYLDVVSAKDKTGTHPVTLTWLKSPTGNFIGWYVYLGCMLFNLIGQTRSRLGLRATHKCLLSISTCPLVGKASDVFASKTFYKTEIDILNERYNKFQIKSAMIQLPDSIEYNK